jgi:hypothetical protein
MLKLGTWFISSKSDPRWNASGKALVGLFGIPDEAKNKVAFLKLEYGEPPADLEWGYVKD